MRKLAIAALSYSAAIFAANYILPHNVLIPMAALFLLLSLMLFKSGRKWLRGVLISLFAVSLALTAFALHYTLTNRRAEKFSGREAELQCVVLDYPDVYDDYCRVDVRLSTPDLPAFKAILYDNSMSLPHAVPGDKIELKGRLSSAGIKYGEDYDYYNSYGVYLVINSLGDIKVVENSSAMSLLPVKLNCIIGNRIDEIFPEDTAAFVKSLLIGDKTELYKDRASYLALSKAGLMHIVAISGMHIAFLVELYSVIFGRGRKRSIFAVLFIWCYVLITGMSPSAVRAAVMQTFVLFAPILRRENDSISSLSAALAIILLFNPYAATGLSLQLSFLATAGILFISPRISKILTALLPGKIKQYLRPIIKIISSSVAGTLFTAPVVAANFGYISLYSILSNLLVLPVISFVFCVSFAAVLLSVCPLGAFAAGFAALPARYVLWTAKFVSSIPGAVIYLKSGLMWAWFILSYILIAAIFLGKIKTLYKIIIPIAFSLASLAFVLTSSKLFYDKGAGSFCVLNVGQGQCVVAFAKDKTIVVDCGSTDNYDSVGDTLNAYLQHCGRDKVDVLILSHFHQDHVNGVDELLNSFEVVTVIMPYEFENKKLHDDIILSANNSELRYIQHDTNLELGDFSVMLYLSEDVEENERILMSKLSIGAYDMLITSDADKISEIKLAEKYDLSGTEVYVAGHHGSRYSNSDELLSELGGGIAVISVGYNTYGHPSYETLERLDYYGYNIYRTDLHGNVEISIG